MWRAQAIAELRSAERVRTPSPTWVVPNLFILRRLLLSSVKLLPINSQPSGSGRTAQPRK